MATSEGFVTTKDGARLFFRTQGSGGKFLIVPNAFYLVDELAQRFSDRTILYFDFHNRGQSDTVADTSKLGIDRDVEDIEAVRQQFSIGQLDFVAHSYVGLIAALYAMRHPATTGRVVQIGPMAPKLNPYPPHLSYSDGVLAQVFGKLAELQKERSSLDDIAFCRKSWELLRQIYVVNPEDAARTDWGRCDLANERNFMSYWTGVLLPSIHKLNVVAEAARATSPVLVIHGAKDRSAPLGGGREWAMMLPSARLVTIENAGHAPWIEAGDIVFSTIKTFLNGDWPQNARKVTAVDPAEEKS